MRLGRMEAKGFIEEPAEISTASHDPVETDREDERADGQQPLPPTAPEGQPTPTA